VIKVVVDTSVFISALLSKNKTGSPAQILTRWRKGDFILVLAPQLIGELVTKLIDYGIQDEVIGDLLVVIDAIALQIEGVVEATFLDDIDPNDNMFLAAAYESNANYLVSLDKKHLLPIKHYHGTQIVDPSIFLNLLSR
jgi:putative PIN family toxin of toxin-antitoxin system